MKAIVRIPSVCKIAYSVLPRFSHVIYYFVRPIYSILSYGLLSIGCIRANPNAGINCRADRRDEREGIKPTKCSLADMPEA